MTGPKPNPNLLKIPLYIAGKSPGEVREEYGLEGEIIKLASNENPLGPSPLAVAALKESLSNAHRYPGISQRDLRRKLAAHHGHGLSEEHFLIANGGTDMLRMIAQTFVYDGGQTVMSDLTFPMYRIFTDMFGGSTVILKPTAGLGIDLQAMQAAVNDDTRIVWLCSPNNPTGLILTHRDVKAFMRDVPEHVVVVIDESYIAFVEDEQNVDSLEFIQAGLPAISLRSFSKSAGLANLRIGYCIANPEFVEHLAHAVLPFNTGSPAIEAAIASLDDHEHLRRSQKLISEERRFLHDSLLKMGLASLPSQANYVLIHSLPISGQEIAEQLMRRGIIVRGMAAWGLPEALRVSVGTREHNLRFLEELADVLIAVQASQD